MDKNKIKSFAAWARRKLISSVSERANRIGVAENKIQDAVAVQGGFKLEGNNEIFKLSKDNRDKLVREVNEKGFEQVMEEVAYTWFNRFMGLRYMEVNEYLPTGIRVLSSQLDGKTEPDALSKVYNIIEELSLDIKKVDNLISDTDENGNEKTSKQKQNDIRELYKYILVRQCNELGNIIPQMFEKISDYTELLLPDNLLEEGSVIRKMVEDIEEEDWKEEVEIIGWMYQYYISEKKDEVFAALKKNVKITKENIPAATQLFTPKWIVKYMVENSLGRLWLEGHPNEELQKQWKYYLEEAEQESEVEEELKKIREEHSKLKPEDIKVLDPCMGSGHILVYAFDVLYKIYETAGYSEREIPRLILQNNLYGLDIDDRAAQLASFALIMKARHYNRRLFREIEREHLELNLCSIQESNLIRGQWTECNCRLGEITDYFCSINGVLNEQLKNGFEYLVNTFVNAKEYGSILEVEKVNFEALKERLKEIEREENFIFGDYRKVILDKLPKIIKQAEIMSRKYEVCVTNPPYMGNGGMRESLSNFIKMNYPNSKSDLFAVFIEKGFDMVKKNGFSCMVTMQSWMFLSSFQKMREMILVNRTIMTLLHMDNMVMGIAFGTSATVFRNSKIYDYKGKYNFISISNIGIDNTPMEFPSSEKRNTVTKSRTFMDIPGSPIAYWASEKLREAFKNKLFFDFSISEGKNVTGNNERFLRHIWEVNNRSIGLNQKWLLYAKGGVYRKWYGNFEYIIDWSDKARKHYRKDKVARIIPEYLWHKIGISWTYATSGLPSFRVLPKNATFDSGGLSIFLKNDDEINYFLGLFNSKVFLEFQSILNQTVNLFIQDVRNIPIANGEIYFNRIVDIVGKNINISIHEWNLFEISLDFKVHPLLKLLDRNEQNKLESVFTTWKTECEENFKQLKHNEEELNRIFIDIYGLQDELTPEVEDKDITIRKADRERDIKSFISYAVGCMLGRYSIDSEGLIYAGGEFKDKWDLEEKKVRKIEKNDDGNIISDSWVDATFMPDADNVLPITEDEYFEDDIVSRFIDFVRTVYSEETLEENLDFIADSIGRKPSETARQVIRRYFIKDFYKDHLKVYKKRPIYWMFESGKNDGFKALVYMHRYNEQTVARVRTDYLHTLQRKYEAEIQRQQLIVNSEEYTAKDRRDAKKKIDRIVKQIEECREYDQVVAHLANERISIDLDDGVKVNYAKFQGVKVINSKGKEVKMDLLAKI
ncbi:BREX-1 system adenine-specific DNA-methyltransferase PglX [Haloimpatiens massiliensis]|uniref:BREX-1 system adenine-specific DNA-methyltransferase PglX n=1 Tax=Haloimpatiens massiliensis TaxID=1658110 RepID=UPI000C83402F|nr:BREX-1 system adenine-specific DNA-methyltransferase PglX [Haloimpatiens massiliensis]